MCLARLVSSTSPSLLSNTTTAPTSTPRSSVLWGSKALSEEGRQWMGQNGGWDNREEEEGDEGSRHKINLLSLCSNVM